MTDSYLATHPRLRLLTVAGVLVRMYARTWGIRPLKPALGRDRYWEVKKGVARRNGRMLYKNILRLKGLFIKVGQFLSVRVDLLPKAYTRELTKLQDQVPAADYAQIRRRVEAELKQPIEKAFREFRPVPIAAASLGQVHEAWLHDGTRVAVKVQYPGIEDVVNCDLEILRLIMKWYAMFRREFQSTFLLEEFRQHVSRELDYVQEGKSAERVARNFGDDSRVVVPKVIWSHTTLKVLTLEFIEGIKITDRDRILAAGYEMADISKLLMDCYFRQIFRDGFFHADAHPGNLFIVPGPKLALLDFGLSKEMDPKFLPNFIGLAAAIYGKDPKQASECFRELGLRVLNQKEDTFLEFSEFIIKNMDDVIYKNPKKIDYQSIMDQVLEMVRTHPVVNIPSDFVLLGRLLGQLSGIGRQLGVSVNMQEVLLPHLAGAR
ncbi:MAG: AarF/ABC1/UbiB kinase family protein [Nitrospirae bacterium]|nr:AarF/ABC1/UbiB kinase family protein [Nitrospirota bacterium]